MTCRVLDCTTERIEGHGYCVKHYKRWRRHGDPLVVTYMRGQSLEDRFWARVDRTEAWWNHCVDGTYCWLWTGAVNHEGYGTIGTGGEFGRKMGVHQVSWDLHFPDKPRGRLQVRHRCDVRNCVRPEHLVLGTHADNMRDMAERGRAPAVVHPDRVPRGDQHWTRRRIQEGRLEP